MLPLFFFSCFVNSGGDVERDYTKCCTVLKNGCGGISLDERKKSVWKQIKHLSSTTEDIVFFIPFFFFFGSKLLHREPSLYSHRTGLQSPANIITVRFFHPHPPTPTPETTTGGWRTRKRTAKEKDVLRRKRRTLLGQRLCITRLKN